MTIFIWGLIFLIAAIITGIMGFKGARGNPAARVFFYIFLILFLAALGYGLWQKYSYKLPANMQMTGDSNDQSDATMNDPGC